MTTDHQADIQHVAIIMDGNGRWAQARGLPRIEGHRHGAKSVRTAIECSVKYGIRYLTLYSFSSENWNRPQNEVEDLMGLLRRYLRSEIAELQQNGIRLRVIGNRGELSPDIVALIEESENCTAGNRALDLTIAVSYGGRSEITAAAKLGSKLWTTDYHELLRSADVDGTDDGVGAPLYLAVQQLRQMDIGAELGSAGDLVQAVVANGPGTQHLVWCFAGGFLGSHGLPP